MAKIIRLLDLGDIHCGHEVGMWPDKDMPLPGGNEIGINAGQRYLLEHWRRLRTLVKEEIKPDIVVVHGDVCDGEGRKSLGHEQLTTMMGVQVKAAIKLLEPITSLAKEVYGLRGTPYHDGGRGMVADNVYKELGAIGETSQYAGWSLLDLDVQGVILNFQHAISVATGFYRATPLDREGIWSALAGKEFKTPKADVVLRAHAHVFVHVEHPSKHIAISPCWQLQTEYMRRHSAYRMLPDIGALVIDIDPAAKKRGDDPILLRKFMVPLPERKAFRSKVAE